jgi:hypothetical protein
VVSNIFLLLPFFRKFMPLFSICFNLLLEGVPDAVKVDRPLLRFLAAGVNPGAGWASVSTAAKPPFATCRRQVALRAVIEDSPAWD